MNKDPFVELIGFVRHEGAFYNEPSFFMGTITGSLPNLKVAVQGVELDKSNLKIDKFLLDRHNVSITCSAGNVSHNLSDTLKVGDTVLMIRNDSTFTIISKVVAI